MRRFVSVSCCLAAALLIGVLAGCDSSPSNVEDFEIQPNLNTSRSSLVFTSGQSPAPTFQTTYQGLDSHPQAEVRGGLSVEKLAESGTPADGSQQWAVSFGDEVEGNAVQGTIVLQSSSGGREIADSISVTVNNPVSIASDFVTRFVAVADYEDAQRETVAEGGTTVEVQSDEVSENSGGLNALRVDAAAGGAVTFNRQASLPGSDVFSFLLKPDADTDFTLTLTFTEDTGGATASYDLDVPVAAGEDWRQYNIAVGQLFADFNPVAARDGGSGPLLSVSLTADEAATYYLDDVLFGTSTAGRVEINDFEETSNAYIGATVRSDTTLVGPMADGTTALSLTYTEGGNFFGYNYNRLRLDATSGGEVNVRIGEVSKAFNLWVFVETVDDGGRAGGYSYDNGVETPIAAGADFREVTIPLGNLGMDPAALHAPGIVNVGFEIRRPSSDDTIEPISFILDDVKLRSGE